MTFAARFGFSLFPFCGSLITPRQVSARSWMPCLGPVQLRNLLAEFVKDLVFVAESM